MIDAPMPDRIKRLPKDHRGYPIPYVVLIDKMGNPQFTINDQIKVARAIKRDLCHICGQMLTRGRWFIGGPLSAFHPQGAYFDGPLHHECMQYAAKVCPYLAMRSYQKRIDDAKLKDPTEVVLVDNTMIATRPDVFVAVMSIGHERTRTGHFKPHKPYKNIEYWRDGILIPEEEAHKTIKAQLEKPIPPLQPARILRGFE